MVSALDSRALGPLSNPGRGQLRYIPGQDTLHINVVVVVVVVVVYSHSASLRPGVLMVNFSNAGG